MSVFAERKFFLAAKKRKASCKAAEKCTESRKAEGGKAVSRSRTDASGHLDGMTKRKRPRPFPATLPGLVRHASPQTQPNESKYAGKLTLRPFPPWAPRPYFPRSPPTGRNTRFSRIPRDILTKCQTTHKETVQGRTVPPPARFPYCLLCLARQRPTATLRPFAM